MTALGELVRQRGVPTVAAVRTATREALVAAAADRRVARVIDARDVDGEILGVIRPERQQRWRVFDRAERAVPEASYAVERAMYAHAAPGARFELCDRPCDEPWAALSAEVRTHARRTALPFRGMVYDRVGFLSFDFDDMSAGAWRIADRELLDDLDALFAALWREADALYTPDGGHDVLAVLRELVRGVPDEAAARHLHVSLRTYRRRVAELMAAFGARSRFDLGSIAERRGLIALLDGDVTRSAAG